jgi:hypothetical protein
VRIILVSEFVLQQLLQRNTKSFDAGIHSSILICQILPSFFHIKETAIMHLIFLSNMRERGKGEIRLFPLYLVSCLGIRLNFQLHPTNQPQIIHHNWGYSLGRFIRSNLSRIPPNSCQCVSIINTDLNIGAS